MQSHNWEIIATRRINRDAWVHLATNKKAWEVRQMTYEGTRTKRTFKDKQKAIAFYQDIGGYYESSDAQIS